MTNNLPSGKTIRSPKGRVANPAHVSKSANEDARTGDLPRWCGRRGLSESDWRKVINFVPKTANERRLELLPKVLEYWGQHNLLEICSIYDRDEILNRQRRQDSAIRAARVLRELDEIDMHQLALRMIQWSGNANELSYSEKKAVEAELLQIRKSVCRIADVDLSKKRGRGQPPKDVRFLIICDLAAVYEWLTGKRATRTEKGQEKGPFGKFVRAVWGTLYGTDDDVYAAVRNWDSYPKDQRGSALLANIHLSHPEWRVFEKIT